MTMDKLDVLEPPYPSLWTLCIAGCFVWPGLFIMFWSILAQRYPPYLACGTAMRLVSCVQAVIQVCCGAVIVSRTYTDVFFKDCKLLDQSFAFAAMYWFYDTVAMYMVYCREKQLMKSTVLTSLRSFLKDNPLLCFHHFLVLIGGNSLTLYYRFGKAAFMIACVQLTELSTPFLNIRKILIKHNLTHSSLFRVNTAVAVATFFVTRLVLFPAIYLIYAYCYDQTLWEVVTSMYFGCHFVMFVVMSLQVAWFVSFIKAISKQPRQKAMYKEHENGHSEQDGHPNGRDISYAIKSE